MLAHTAAANIIRTEILLRRPENRSSTTPAATRPDGRPSAWHPIPASWSEESVTPVCDFPLRPTYREVTACGGTFPDTVTYLHGSNTPIGSGSSATCAAQALHLPESGTVISFVLGSFYGSRGWIQKRHLTFGKPLSRPPLPLRSPAVSARGTTSWPS